jgi:rSAM/selenodomain-associated transferase 2
MSRISIIIPVLNESVNVRRAIESTMPSENVEVIVVDGGSTDDTCQVAQASGARVIASAAGRSRQMNLGAAAATGDILLFLHGDSRLPVGFDQLIRQIMLVDKPPIAGAFSLAIDDSTQSLRWVEKGVNWRSRFCQMPYGDQGIFLMTKVFEELGGFPELPIMEDFELMRRLRQQGKISIISQPILTSARRWLQKGILKTTLINQLMVLGYWSGVSPVRLVKLYRQKNVDN